MAAFIQQVKAVAVSKADDVCAITTVQVRSPLNSFLIVYYERSGVTTPLMSKWLKQRQTLRRNGIHPQRLAAG